MKHAYTFIREESSVLLAVDIGNTNIVFGVHDNERWVRHWRVRTVRDKMPDEYGVLLRTFLGEADLTVEALNRSVISSVVPPVTGTIREMLSAQTGLEPLIVSHKVVTGLTFAVDNPAEVGADLIANAVAAHARFQHACVIVDFGTATTFTAVSAEAEFLGVAIAPGVNLAASALAGGTAQLPQIYLAAPPQAIGTNTIHAIQSGIILGYLALVEGIIDRFLEALANPNSSGDEVTVVATGGLSRLIVPLSDRFAEVDERLTLEGIRLIAARNPHH
jgi:type III pantothenate kinase